jgi:hypothetical protein
LSWPFPVDEPEVASPGLAAEPFSGGALTTRTQLEDLMGGAVPRLCMTFVDFNLDYLTRLPRHPTSVSTGKAVQDVYPADASPLASIWER